MSRKSVKVIIANGAHFYAAPQFAKELLKARTARIVSSKPFVIRLIPMLTTFGTLVPADCKEFRDFFIEQLTRAKTNKPLWAVNKQFEQYQWDKLEEAKKNRANR